MLILLCIVAAILLLISAYIFKCTHYWQRDARKTAAAGFTEKQAVLPDGSIIHYAEGPERANALLLIHGQTGAWQDYSRVLPALSQHWHVFAVDCYGHGRSSHDEAKYYLKEHGDDLIWFVREIIQKQTVVSGHSSGGLLAAYVAAYGGAHIAGAMLEDPPVFSTQRDCFETTFAYLDTYLPLHHYAASEQTECWEAYYLRHCLWGQLYMASSMDGLANYAQRYRDKHPGKPVQFFFMPESINFMFRYWPTYDLAFGEHFYNYTWHSGIEHEDLLRSINVPTVFLHAEEHYSDDGTLLAASSNEQAERAAKLIAQCTLTHVKGNHDIHRFNPEAFTGAVNRVANQLKEGTSC